MVVEGAGAAGLAAILAGQLDEFKDKKYFKFNFDQLHSFIVDYLFVYCGLLVYRVVLLLCGGNIDTTTFGRCLERGLASEGRLLRFELYFYSSARNFFFF